MADNRIKNRNRSVDDAGIRLAPTPIHGGSYPILPPVRQEFVIEPRIEIDEPNRDGDLRGEVSTAKDFQPKSQDKSKKWKRQKRAKNMLFGSLMFIASAIVVLPFIFGATGVDVSFLHFEYVPTRFNAIQNIVDAINVSAVNGWSGAVVNEAWIHTVPALILSVGILCIVVNIVKSLFALFGAVKPVKYVPCAIVYCASVCAVLVAALIGASEIGVEKIDFLQEFYYSYKTSDIFVLVVIAFCYLTVSALCTRFNVDKSGYLK